MAFSRQHYMPGMSLVSKDNDTLEDMAEQDKTVCLKVYTVETEGEWFFLIYLRLNFHEILTCSTLQKFNK